MAKGTELAEHMATTRATIRKQQRQEELREKFKVAEYIKQLEGIATQYDELAAAMDVAVSRRKTLTKKQRELLVVTNMQIDALRFKMDVLKAKADLNFRRLKFVLPELKSVELSDPNGKNPLGELANALREAVSGTST